ncbi:PREDICTED: uncharacterized protein C17orf78 homolog [Calidris pugnax]|uniref:uncharacterized protein C17orf78 homolog n=1 Tax=Calidris pugnax TaxID=198806 RepID=UPI00071C7DF7|nr:PREDICTED: uncharacterized protein C17orf78 homolog [Calidris pugnax]
MPCGKRLGNIWQSPGIAGAKGELSRTPKVITLECFGLPNPVRVDVLYWEEVHRDLTNQTAERCTLQSLRVAASADRKPAPGHTCLLLTHHRDNPQRKLIFNEKVFQAGTLNYVTTTNLPKLEVSGEGLTVPHVHQEKQTLEERIPSSNDKDMLNRRKISIVIKVFIACILLAFTIPYITFCICEIPCPCLCSARIKSLWNSSRSWLLAACILVQDRTAMLLNKLLKDKEQEALEALV